MRRTAKVAGAVAAGVGLATAVVAIANAEGHREPLPLSTSAPPGTRVAVLGDSITYLSGPALTSRFSERRFSAPVVSGIPGIRSDQRVDESAQLLADVPPDVLVIELGANDVGQFVHDHPGADDEARRWHGLQTVVNEARIVSNAGPQVQCVVLVNVSGNTLTPEANDDAKAINRSMEVWAVRDSRVRVADWHGLVADEFARGEPDGKMTTDLVHPTEHGADRLADLVVSTIDRCSVLPPPPG